MTAPITGALKSRAASLPLKEIEVPQPSAPGNTWKFEGVERFGLFIDTHRDQPHIGNFFEDIHRGQSRPTLVHYDPAQDLFIEDSSGKTLERHPKHMFITEQWFAEWLIARMSNGESDPRDADGVMATSHLRDARNKVYELKSFRQILMEHWLEAQAPASQA